MIGNQRGELLGLIGFLLISSVLVYLFPPAPYVRTNLESSLESPGM